MDNLDFSSMVPQPSATQLRMGGRAKRRRYADLKWWFSKRRIITGRPLSGMFEKPTQTAAKSILILAHYNNGLGIKLIADKLFGTRAVILGIRQVLVGAGIYGRNARIRRGPTDRPLNHGSPAKEIQDHGRMERQHERWWVRSNMHRPTPMEVYYSNHEARKAYGRHRSRIKYANGLTPQEKAKRKESARKWNLNNRERKKATARQWRQDNPSKWRSYRMKPCVRMVDNLRRRLRDFIGCCGLKHNELFGCSPRWLRGHIEAGFTVGMTWQNYGLWHIDHIKPCASFDLKEIQQQRDCFNWTNLQPLWAVDNMRKGSKTA